MCIGWMTAPMRESAIWRKHISGQFGKLDADEVAGLHAGTDQPGGERVGDLLELGEGVPTRSCDQGDVVRPLGHALVEEIVQGAVAPVSAGDPTLAVLLGEAGIPAGVAVALGKGVRGVAHGLSWKFGGRVTFCTC